MKSQASYGSKNGRAKLTERKVRNIKRELARGVGVNEVARKYGVNKSTVSRINSGKIWAQVQV